jgi:hypothetical protein
MDKLQTEIDELKEEKKQLEEELKTLPAALANAQKLSQYNRSSTLLARKIDLPGEIAELENEINKLNFKIRQQKTVDDEFKRLGKFGGRRTRRTRRTRRNRKQRKTRNRKTRRQ